MSGIYMYCLCVAELTPNEIWNTLPDTHDPTKRRILIDALCAKVSEGLAAPECKLDELTSPTYPFTCLLKEIVDSVQEPTGKFKRLWEKHTEEYRKALHDQWVRTDEGPAWNTAFDNVKQSYMQLVHMAIHNTHNLGV